jgi:uncharacterized membrane protein YiaA
MISLLLTLILIGVVIYLVGLIPMDARIMQLIRVVGIILAVLVVLDAFGVITGVMPVTRGHLRLP